MTPRIAAIIPARGSEWVWISSTGASHEIIMIEVEVEVKADRATHR